MRRAAWLAGAALLGWLAWLAWQPPAGTPPLRQVRPPVPEPPAMRPPARHATKHPADGLWRVVTHRFVWQQAAQEMQRRLAALGAPVIVIARKEDVELHAFDDARLFRHREDALRAKKAWEKQGFDASLVRSDDARFGVALGRLYLAAHARRLQARLAASGMRYRYQRRLVHIATWRFTFPPAPRPKAEALWRKVQQMGVADPALMPEREFRRIYPARSSIKAANRSNK